MQARGTFLKLRGTGGAQPHTYILNLRDCMLVGCFKVCKLISKNPNRLNKLFEFDTLNTGAFTDFIMCFVY